MVVVLGHWMEHFLQTFQIYVLGWPVPQARGMIGLAFPSLVSSEILHYGYALVMLLALWALRPGFTGKQERWWWTLALGIQFFHHFEHALLQCRRSAATTCSAGRCRPASRSSGCRASSCTCSTTRSCSSR